MTTPTLASTNREIVAAIMNELAKGDPRPFADAMSEDFVWRPMGASQLGKWQTRYAGKDEVIHGFFRPLRSQFADTFTNTPRHIYSDGDMVISMAGGKFKEVREYFDSAMSDAMFDPIRR